MKKSARILIVEDESAVARSIQKALELAGYTAVGLASSGEEGVALSAALQPDLVLMDITMPGKLDGIQAAAQIRARQAVPVVYLTASADDATLERAYVTSPAGYLVKPFRFDDFRRTIEIALYQHVQEQKLRESEERYRNTFEHASIGIVNVAPDGRFLQANQRFCDIIGYSQAEVLGLTFQAITHLDDLPGNVAAQQQLETGSLQHYMCEKRYIRKDGQTVWANLTVSAVRESSGALKYFISIIEDITARREAEAALQASETRFRQAMEATRDGLWDWNIQTGEDYCSPPYWQMLGYGPADFPEHNQAWLDHIHPDDRERALAANQACIENRSQDFEVEFRMRTKTGAWKWILSRGQATQRDAQGRALRMTGTHVDITDRKAAEEEICQLNAALEQRVAARTAELTAANAALVRAARVKDEFLATMSHELRTPLTGVLGLSEALQMGVYGPLTDKQRQSLQSIWESGQHLLELITDILDLSKLEAGKMELQFAPTVVHDICQSSLTYIQPAARKKSLRVSASFDAAVEVMQTDGRRLKQILANLLSNAVKFTPVGGEVGLEVAGDPAQCEAHFVIWDTGIGIAPDNQGRLFQPFTQLDSRLAREYEGTGLGLALAQRLAHSLGGHISLESAGVPGQGSRFMLVLPWDPRAVVADLA